MCSYHISFFPSCLFLFINFYNFFYCLYKLKSVMILIWFKYVCRVCQSALSAFNFILHKKQCITKASWVRSVLNHFLYTIDEQNTGPPCLANTQYQECQLSLFDTRFVSYFWLCIPGVRILNVKLIRLAMLLQDQLLYQLLCEREVQVHHVCLL